MAFLACGGLFGLVLSWCLRATRSSLDPDRFYHLMIAREWAASTGIFVTSLPSVDALGWANFFPDKEPLFHLLTGILQRWGGEFAVLLLPALLAGGLIWTLARLLRAYAGEASWPVSLFVVSLGMLLETWFFDRVSMLRPHGLAIFLFFTVLLQIHRKSLRGVFIASVAFALAYHALYLPLIVLAAAVAVEFHGRSSQEWRKQESAWGLFAAGVLGLLVGTLASPSFPGNLVMAWRHLQIAFFEAPGANLNFGMELFPWPTDRFLLQHLGSFIVLALAAREAMMSTSFAKSHKLLLVLCFVFLALSMQSPRAQEYLFPCLLILAGSLVARWTGQKQRRVALLVLGGAFLLPAFLTAGPKPWKSSAEPVGRSEELEFFKILKALPQANPRIFNMEWDSSPRVLYARPDARVVDLLDPSFLAEFDIELHEARQAILQGRLVDVFGFLSYRWQADYLLTRNGPLRSRLERDPHFERIYPVELKEGEALYRLNPETRRNFVANLGQVKGASGLSVKRFGHFDPRSPEFAVLPSSAQALPQLEWRPVYHDLSRLFSKQPASPDGAIPSGMRCGLIRVPPEEVARLRGRTILAVGGVRNIRIWRNGRPLYHSIQMPVEPQVISQLIDLHQPIAATDRFEALACSLESSVVLGASLSFWSESELRAVCARKTWTPPETLDDHRSWDMVGSPRFTCLGDFAMPALRTL
jgi:hypothetical protein